MKKRTVFAILAALFTIGALAAFASGCKRPADPSGAQDPGNYVDYYGCPNSKRVKKLNLRKTRG